MTTKSQVMSLLKENADQRGIAHWTKRQSDLKSFGIGLTKLRKIAKQIGRDHRLAKSLWNSDVYDAKILGLLTDDPKAITPADAERQVEDGLDEGMLAHVFASCDATLAKAPFAFDLARQWVESDDAMRRRCGYYLLYELSKKKSKAIDDDYLLQQVSIIRDSIHHQPMWVREAMNLALLGIGKRNKRLYHAAVAVADAIGPVEVDYGDDNSCQPIDVLQHLTSGHVAAKFAD